jgi:acyl-homoserine-lactone acylase
MKRGGVAALILLAAAAGCRHPRTALPAPDELSREVVIRRDTFGIPHITATTELAAAFGFGYAQAEDHAAEIGRRMISARGEEAKYFGVSGIENDAGMAMFDNLAAARRGLDTVSPLYRAILAAYAAGVNRYVAQHRDSLPVWMPEITAADVLANSRAGAVDALSGPALPRLLRAKYEAASVSPRDGDEAWIDAPGSNALALAASRTTTGKPILLGNPHLSWSSLYWEAHVRVPGRLDFYGSTLAGIPVLRAGFNEHLGFVTTNNAPDLDDVFALSLDPNAPDHYVFDGRSMPLTRRDVTIQVRADDGTLREDRRTFWSSHIGPIVYRTGARAFTVKSTRIEAFRYFEGFYVMSKARSLREWMAAARRNYVPTSNFTYADAAGNILYLWNGQLPVRDESKDYRLDVPAERTADIWTKLHAVDDLPRLLNPRGGYIMNSNNPPRFVSLRDPLDMSKYPRSFERGPLGLRPQLALNMIEERERFSVDDVIRLKYNTRMLIAERVKRGVIDAVTATADAPQEARDGADALEAWDDRVASGSRGAVLFEKFWDNYTAVTRTPFETPWQEENAVRTPAGIGARSAAVSALADAVRSTRQAYGSERVAWGDVNRFRAGTVDLPGDGGNGALGCYRVMRFDEAPGERVRVAGNTGGGKPLAGFGDAWVLVVDFSGGVRARSVVAYGQSSSLDSPHSADQLRIFANHDLRPVWYREGEVRAHVEREYRP